MLSQGFAQYNTLMSEFCHPEMDELPLLNSEGISKYCLMVVGWANWVVTLGQLDVAYALNSFSCYNMAHHDMVI